MARSKRKTVAKSKPATKRRTSKTNLPALPESTPRDSKQRSAKSKAASTSAQVCFCEADGENGFLSPWWPCEFTVKEEVYGSAGQYILAEKARAFGDNKARQRILEEHEIEVLISLGASIKGFDKKSWRRRASRIAKQANTHKFLSNDTESRDLLRQLKNLGRRELVFADPSDSVLGIGFSAAEAAEVDQAQWGANVFAKSLDEVRKTKAWKDQKASDQREVDYSIFDLGGRLSINW